MTSPPAGPWPRLRRPEAAARAAGVLEALRRDDAHYEALARVKAWTRERFGIGEDGDVLVTEVECTIPGGPPRETVVAFWTAARGRHHFKVFKPATEVTRDDVPPAWLRDALALPPGGECNCC